MRRGTTPKLTFTTPYAASLIDHGFITFKQRGQIVLDVPFDDESVTITDQAIAIELTQEQTLGFAASVEMPYCEAQIRAVLTSEKAVASNIVRIPICAILKEGEI